MPALTQTRVNPDQVLRSRLEGLSASDREYWAFRGNSRRGHAHALFQYPAMMVPQMQGELIRAVIAARPGVTSAFDPFVGSGTTLTESMIHGFRFTGWDINPLAILLCLTKAGPFYPAALAKKFREIMRQVDADRSTELETELPRLEKWFRRDVAVDLSRIRRAVRSEGAIWARRFFWVALAEAARLSCNSRTSTFKLHLRSKQDLLSHRPSPLQIFEEAVERNIRHFETQCSLLKESTLITRGRYIHPIQIRLRDATKQQHNPNPTSGHDLLISSPPYGDNKSTVPYGQYSYLPLNWIDGEDIVENWDSGWLKSTHEIDTRSLGGVLARNVDPIGELSALSPAFRGVESALKTYPRDRIKRVGIFCRDLNRCLNPILDEMRPGAYLVWTVGNRRVGGVSIPLDRILTDLLTARGCQQVAELGRRIVSKRMAVKNSVTDTMRAESVLVFRK